MVTVDHNNDVNVIWHNHVLINVDSFGVCMESLQF